jgi:hypothetical protein
VLDENHGDEDDHANGGKDSTYYGEYGRQRSKYCSSKICKCDNRLTLYYLSVMNIISGDSILTTNLATLTRICRPC